MLPEIGEVIAVGIGLVFCGMTTGGRGGGGMWDGLVWPLPWALSNCWFWAPAVDWGGDCMEEGVEAVAFSAIVYGLEGEEVNAIGPKERRGELTGLNA